MQAKEVLVSLPALVLAGLLMFQRELIFFKGRYGLLGDNLPLLGWALVALLLLIAIKPRRFPLRALSLGVATLSLVFVVLASTPWGRYQWVRLQKKTNLTAEILSPDLGPFVLQDRPFMEYLAEHGEGYLEQPRAAQNLLSSLQAHGVTAEQLWERSSNRVFFLACLMAKAGPADKLDRLIVSHFVDLANSNPRPVSEGLVFVMTRFPSLFDPRSRERLTESWASQFKDLEPLAVEGLIRRKQVQAFLGGRDAISLQLEIKGAPSELQTLLAEVVAGLIRSCGVTLQPGGETLHVVLSVREIPHHQFSRPTYRYETYYQEVQARGLKHWHLPRQVQKQRQVLSGSTTETQFAPVIQVTLNYAGQRLEMPETLLFWHHLRFDPERNVFLDINNEGVYGRTWPFGLRQSLYRR
jgi:hypothetical protein